MERVTTDEEVPGVVFERPDGRCFMQQSDLGDAEVGGGDPRVPAVLVREEAQVLVRPRQLKATGGLGSGEGRRRRHATTVVASLQRPAQAPAGQVAEVWPAGSRSSKMGASGWRITVP